MEGIRREERALSRLPGIELLAATLLAAGLAACAGEGPAPTSASRVTPPPAAAAHEVPGDADGDVQALTERRDALYAQLAERVELASAAVELQPDGRVLLDAPRIEATVAWLHAATAECAAIPGCELDRFLAAYDHLARAQSAALEAQQEQLSEAEEPGLEEPEVAEELQPGPVPEKFSGDQVPALHRAASRLRGTELRDLITLNGPVKAALDDWLTWLRPDFLEAYRNYLYLRPQIAPVYKEAGLPEALLFAMVATESGGKVHAYSRAGAAGLLQFMRQTGRKYGLREVDGFDQRLDPVAATRANAAYLDEYFSEFDENLEKVLAAYNGGEYRMRRADQRYGGASFWDRRVYYTFPRETRDYVPRILAAAWLFLHPEEYNLNLPSLDTEITRMELDQPLSLGELTICLGQEGNPDGWFRTLRNLNPRLEPDERMKPGSAIVVPAEVVPIYQQKCHDQPLLVRALELHEANYPEQPEMVIYVVRPGDTLGRIASRFRCASLQEIAAVNRIRPPRYLIRAGQRLKIPGCR